jgi:hypothetical protein
LAWTHQDRLPSYGSWFVVILVLSLPCAARAQTPSKKTDGKLLPAKAAAPWAPENVDASVPGVEAGVPCTLPQVLEGAGARAKELVANLERFTATERVENARMGKNGKWGGPEARTFKYLAFISEVRPGYLTVEEKLDGDHAPDAHPAPVAGTGLTAFALIFHPYYTGDFNMVCEGLGEWHGKPAWQVHFAQRPDLPPRFHSFSTGDKRFDLKLKGRAWISPESFQVTHMDVDIMEPIPQIKLVTEHLAIEYRPVHFQLRDLDVWLPESAELFVDYRGRRLRLSHKLSRYLLFSVDSSQDIGEKQNPR